MAEVFDIPPEFEYGRTSRQRAVSTPPEQGFVQARRLWDAELRRWKLVWHNANDAVVARLEQLWALTFAGVLSMDYTPVGESTIRVQFVGDSLVVKQRSLVAYEAEVELLEVRS